MSRLQQAVDQLKLSRGYLLHLLSNVRDDDWFRMPAGVPTHIGWQVGHLVCSHYHLLLDRLRGHRLVDDVLFPRVQYVELFGRQSQPAAQTGQYPAPAALRQSLAALHAQTDAVTYCHTGFFTTEPAEALAMVPADGGNKSLCGERRAHMPSRPERARHDQVDDCEATDADGRHRRHQRVRDPARGLDRLRLRPIGVAATDRKRACGSHAHCRSWRRS